MLSGFLSRSCVEVEFECLCSFWTKQDISGMRGIIRKVIDGKECLSAEMRAWKLTGHPVVGFWVYGRSPTRRRWPVGLGALQAKLRVVPTTKWPRELCDSAGTCQWCMINLWYPCF